MSVIKEIEGWFKAAVPNPTEDTLRVQLGVHFEEVSEMLEAVGEQDTAAFEGMTDLAEMFKGTKFALASQNNDALLDSLVDQIVTAIGVAHMKGFDIEGALHEVSRSNNSKFVDGKPIFNENGKIMKGPHYVAPNLTQFLSRG